MSFSWNRVTVGGNVTRDIEVRYTQGGTAVTDLGLAVNERTKKDGEYVDTVVWLDVTLWGRTAEVAGQYLKKGSPVLIAGRLQLDQWEDRETGQKRTKLKVVGERLQLIGSKPSQEQSADPGAYAAPDAYAVPDPDNPNDPIPF